MPRIHACLSADKENAIPIREFVAFNVLEKIKGSSVCKPVFLFPKNYC